MAEIKAIPVHMGDKEFIGPTFVQLQLTGYMGNSETGILLTPNLSNADEVDYAVECLIREIEKAGKAAIKLLSKRCGNKLGGAC